MSNLILPSYSQGFARSAAESAAPGLWAGLAGAWLPFLGPTGTVLRDWGGRQNHGTLTNMTGADWVMGDKGWALDFPDADDAITVGDVPIFDDLTAFTWLMRVKHDTTAADHDLVVRGTHDAMAPFLLWMDNAGTDSYKMIVTSGGAGSGAKTSAFTPVAGVWYDLAFTFLASTEMRLYIDGVEDANSPFATGEGTLNNTGIGDNVVRFGNDAAGTKGLDGQIGHAMFYTRVLTANEIAQLYADPFGMFRMRQIASLGGAKRPAHVIGGGIAA